MKLYFLPLLLTAVAAVSFEDLVKEEWKTFKVSFRVFESSFFTFVIFVSSFVLVFAK